MGLSVFPAPSGASFSAVQPTLQQTITSTSSSLTYPAGTNFVYAMVINGGDGGFNGVGSSVAGGAGGASGVVTFGYVPAAPNVTIGAGGSPNGSGGTSVYSLIGVGSALATTSFYVRTTQVAGGGGMNNSNQAVPGNNGIYNGSGSGSNNRNLGDGWSSPAGGNTTGLLTNRTGGAGGVFRGGGSGGAGFLANGSNGLDTGKGGAGGSGGGGGGGGASGSVANTNTEGGAGGGGCVLLYY